MFKSLGKGNQKILLAILFTITALLLVACGDEGSTEEGGSSSKSKKENISLGTYQPGTAYHSVASGIASVISNNSSTVNATVRPFSGPQAWYPLMNEGSVDLGLTDFHVNWAYQGIKGNEEKNPNIRTLVAGNTVPVVGYAVREDSKINSLKDLKGKKLAYYTATPESFIPYLEIQLASVGLTWDDVTKVPVSDIVQGLDALREGRVDAAFTGDPSVGIFLEVDSSLKIKGLNLGDIKPEDFDDFPEDFREEMKEKSAGIDPVVLEGGFLKEPTVILEEPVVLVASNELSEESAYEVVETLFENYEELAPIFSWLEDWTPETMFRPDPPAPYHPGVIKYFKENDIWTDEAEENHQELMELVN